MNNLTLYTPLVKYLETHPSEWDFPDKTVNYFDRFRSLETYLNKSVHPNVNQGATANGDGWLTDHGPQHIATVIRRASELVMTSDDKTFLTPYETFILLMACHFHDVGNVFGRDNHEKKIQNVLTQIANDVGRQTLGSDAFEVRMLTNIAMAHGGYVEGSSTDKDTINQLRTQWPTSDQGVRVVLLAAILRFADELADDFSRTSRFLLASDVIPPECEVYHTYADRLKEVKVRPLENHVSVRFELTKADTQKKFQKGRRKVYLFDEIANRALKMHHEHVYCSRFFYGKVHIDSIAIKVNISRDFGAGNIVKPLRTLSFTMHQVGYPDHAKSLGEISPKLAGLDGRELRRQIAEEIEA